jgi:hypothetical protein
VPGYNRATLTPIFIAALFTIAKFWKQLRCPQLMNTLRKCGIYTQWSMWYIHTMEYHSGIKKNEIMLFSGKRKEVENMLS